MATSQASKPRKNGSEDNGNRRADIVRAAGRLFRENGYSATTIRDIADAVNMRSGSPFYHFKTKQEMLRAVVLEGVDGIHVAVAAAAARPLPPRERFAAMVQSHCDVLLGDEGRDFAAVLLHEARYLDEEALAEIVRHKDEYEALWQGVLGELKRAGLIADDSGVTRLFLMGAMNWTSQWYRPDGKLTPRKIARQLVDFVLGPAGKGD